MNKKKTCRYILLSFMLITICMSLLYGYKVYSSKIQKQCFRAPIENTRGEIITLDYLQNTPCIMLFFNTQCDLCLAEIALIKEHLKKISKMYNIFLISFEPKRSLISFFTEKGIDINNKNIHISADEDMILLDYYQIKGYPSFIILNTKYKMEYRGSAIDNSIISKLLKQNL